MSEKINVIIDCRMVDENFHGIARYTYEIVKNISLNNEFKLMLLMNDESLFNKIFGSFNNVEFIKMKHKFLDPREQLELPVVLNKYKGKAIFHSPSFVSSPFIKLRTLMTIHDLNHLRFPQFYSSFHKYYYNYVVKPSALKSKVILTVSQFSKNEIVSWLNCENDKVTVTYNGVDPAFSILKNKEELDAVKSKYSLPKSFILYVGNLKPHKNVTTLVKSLQYVEDVNLVINGKPTEELTKLIQDHGLQERIKFIGYVDDKDLPYLYNIAEAFVFPSLYEGFGLPPLEAMACGCPVVVSNTSSLPEVVGDAAILVNPTDERKMGESIKLIIIDTKLREKLIEKGLERVKSFSWISLAKETEAIYKKM